MPPSGKSTRSEKFRFWTYVKRRSVGLQVFAVILGVLIFSFMRPYSALKYSEGIDILVAFSILLALFDLLRKQATTRKEWTERATHTAVEIFIALGIGASLNLLIHKAGDPNAVVHLAWGEELAKSLGLAVLVFGANLVAESTGTVKQFDKTIEDFRGLVESSREIIDSAREGLAHAHYAGVAAKALNIQLKWLEIHAKPDEALGFSLEPTLNALRAWIAKGQTFLDDGSQLSQINRTAWWRIMRIYHQEEVFDISRFEVATNVRNYCYIILGLIAEFLREASDKMAPIEGKKLNLVVLQVTPFAPKDFYNFPNGTTNNRFYHEAEYFGTYRRVLSALSRDPHVRPLRIFLAAPGTGDNSTKSIRGLGWTLDSIDKLVLDCARYRIVPMPVIDRSRRAKEETKREDQALWDFEGDKKSLKDSLCITFPDHHNPAERLPYPVNRVLWAPTYIDLKNADYNNFSREFRKRYPDSDQVITPKMRDGWYHRALTFEGHGDTLPEGRGRSTTRLDKVLKNRDAIWPNYFRPESSISYQKRAHDAWEKMIDRLCKLTGADQTIVTTLVETDELLDLSKRREQLSESLKSALDNSSAQDLDDVFRHVEILTEVRRLADSCSETLAELPQTATEHAGKTYTDFLLKLVDMCQAADSSLQFLEKGVNNEGSAQIANDYDNTAEIDLTSSSGTDLGLAENWLHRFLIAQEAQRLSKVITNQGPIPLWKLFFSDLLGADTLNASSQSISGMSEQLLRGYRIAVVGDESDQRSTEVTTTAREIESSNISSEFLLLGLTSKSKSEELNIDDENFQVLIRADINEPFHTCRISMRFGGPEVKRHQTWAKKVWRNSENITEEFLRSLEYEVAVTEDSDAEEGSPQ